MQHSCDGPSEDTIDALLSKWLARLPHPNTGAERAAGNRYDISILQAEFSLTQMLDQPVSGRHPREVPDPGDHRARHPEP